MMCARLPGCGIVLVAKFIVGNRGAVVPRNHPE